MCLLVLAWEAHPRYRLIVAANRDEFHERPTVPMAKWSEPYDIIGGRDQRAGGTWLALDRQRRFGVVTNFRELQPPTSRATSRGNLIPDYLRGTQNARNYLANLERNAGEYSGFNLLLADGDSLWYASNRAEQFARRLPAGVYGLSNEFLDTPWPKLRRVRRQFDAWLEGSKQFQEQGASRADLFAILADTTQAGVDEQLPKTGLDPDWEQLLSSPFIRNDRYGTRCSTVVLQEPGGAVSLSERRFNPQGVATGETEFVLGAVDWP
jgi:uncharacterized protein with NRDE domain